MRYYAFAKRLHGVHSPYVYQFQNDIILDDQIHPEYLAIESLMQECKSNHEKITFYDLGANPGTRSRTVSELAVKSGITQKYGRLLCRIARASKPLRILELGTSLGFAASYMLAGAGGETQLVTMEGAVEIARKAQEHFNRLGFNRKVELVKGPIDDTLEAVLAQWAPFDLVYMDANHQLLPTLNYFESISKHITEKAIIIVDDIRWSQEMAEAWRQLCKNPKVSISIELDRMGLLFCRTGIAKEHFLLRF